MRHPALVVLVVSLCMVRPSARQVEPLPSLTDVDRELITAVLSDAANWRDSEVAPGATLELAEQTIATCVPGKSAEPCMDSGMVASLSPPKAVPDFDDLRSPFAARNQRSWRVGPMTIALFLRGASSPDSASISTSYRPGRFSLPTLGGNRLIRVSAPGFSADGQRALLYVWAGGRCAESDGSGKGSLILAERKGGQWLRRSVGIMWIDVICELPPQPKRLP